MKRTMNIQLTEDIRGALSAYYPISKETAKELSNHTDKRHVEVGHFVEKESQIVQSEFVVLEGIIRSFTIDSKGNDISTDFFQAGKAITPTLMRSLNDKAFYSLQVISKTATLLEFNKKGMFEGMGQFEDLQMFGYQAMMVSASHQAEKEVVMLRCNGREKLNWFRAQFPELEGEIPHYYIASYLGMTPTSLSRLRGKK
jgi:CRP-like cAMP-binding protein